MFSRKNMLKKGIPPLKCAKNEIIVIEVSDMDQEHLRLVRSLALSSSCDCGATCPPPVGGSISRFTFFAPSAVRGGPAKTLFAKHDFLEMAHGFARRGWYERAALTKNDVLTCPCVVLDDIFPTGPAHVALRPQNQPNSRCGCILGVISPD